MNNVLIFLHILKAGGSTLRNVVKLNYGKKQIYQVNDKRVNECIKKDLEKFKNDNLKYNRFRKPFFKIKDLAQGLHRFSRDINLLTSNVM